MIIASLVVNVAIVSLDTLPIRVSLHLMVVFDTVPSYVKTLDSREEVDYLASSQLLNPPN